MTLLRLSLCALLAAPLIAPVALGQTFPSKPIRLVVPYAPGGGSDLFARPVAQKLTELLGQPVVVENKPGATGIIGADFVAKSAADGYTLLVAFASQYLQPFVSKNVPFDNLRDFTPIIAAARAPICIVVHPSLPAASMRELVAYARANPGKIAYVTAGANSSQHLAGLLLASAANVDLVHVAYKGGAPALADLLGGQVQMGILIMSTVMPHVRSGRLRALGVVEATRARAAPELLTVGEGGIPGYAMPDLWIGVLGPRGLAPTVVTRVNAEVNKTVDSPDVRPRLESLGYEVGGNTPEQFAQTIARSVEVYRGIVAAAGIRPE